MLFLRARIKVSYPGLIFQKNRKSETFSKIDVVKQVETGLFLNIQSQNLPLISCITF